MELCCRWTLDAPPSGTALLAGVPAVPMTTDQPVPWRLGVRDATVELRVGPWDPDPSAALSAFHALHGAIALGLPAAHVQRQRLGVAVAPPTRPATDDELATLSAYAAAILLPPAQAAGVPRLLLTRDGSRLVVLLDAELADEAFDELAPLIAGTLHALTRDVLWGRAPDLPRAPEQVTATADGCTLGTGAPLSPMSAAAAADYLRPPTRALADGPPRPATPMAPLSATRGGIVIRPFRPGGRPVDELAGPGRGCSEFGGFVSSDGTPPGDDGLWILFSLGALSGTAAVTVRASAWFAPADGPAVPIPGLQQRDVPPGRVGVDASHQPVVVASEYRTGDPESYVLAIDPQRELLPGTGSWSWDELPDAFRALTPDGADPYTLANLFHQRVRVRLDVLLDGVPVGYDEVDVEVYDLHRVGSLYHRVLHLVIEDTGAQAARIGTDGLYAAHHPWYPVLAIGMNKADLYMKAVRQDVAEQTHHLASPRWLLRVGIMLEVLTCLGIFEVLRPTHPNLLTREERAVVDTSPRFAQVRSWIDVAAWRPVWDLHEIVPATARVAAAGPVSFLNLMRKQQSTLAFLHAHHADLKNAIEWAGPLLRGSQEAWHRVYRDAERAVVISSLAAFPELRHLPAKYREFALWHTQGNFDAIRGLGLVPGWLSSLFGDQDGVYPSGARNYRASMNEVAEWARARQLMDHVGAECVPRSVSLIEARLDGDEDRFASLQARDGYGSDFTHVSHTIRLQTAASVDTVVSLLRTVPLFAELDDDEIRTLATGLERRGVVPEEDVIVEGAAGRSLFVIEGGLLHVLRRGLDHPVGYLHAGEVFGEMSLLTGLARSSTVRAARYATVFEISRDRLAPIVQARPRLVEALAAVAAERAAKGVPAGRSGLGAQVAAFLGVAEAPAPAERVAPEAAVARLRQTKVFAPLSDEETAQLARHAMARTLTDGQAAIVQGERGTSLFVIDEGRFAVLVDGRRVATLATGETFGEMALMTGERRAATVRAEGTARVLEITKADLFPIISRRPPVILEFSELLASRMPTDESAPARKRDRVARRIRGFFLG